MLKRMVISGIAALVLVFSIVGMVMAQTPEPPADTPSTVPETCPFDGECPYGKGASAGGQYGTMGGGHHGGSAYGYMGTLPALVAEALGMTVDNLTAALADGTTIADLAQAQGVELADLAATLVEPRATALQAAVAVGTLTQEQADLMIAQMENHMLLMLEQGFGFGGGTGGYGSGNCPMQGGSTPNGSTTPNGFTPRGGGRGRGRQ